MTMSNAPRGMASSAAASIGPSAAKRNANSRARSTVPVRDDERIGTQRQQRAITPRAAPPAPRRSNRVHGDLARKVFA
jgi:hypothetical protein